MNRFRCNRTGGRGPGRHGREGFTLIELLIVVVILGILAAIAIPQYSHTKESAYDAAAKSDLRNLMTQQENHYVEYGRYASDLQPTGSSDSSTVVFAGSSDLVVGENLDIISGGGDASPDQYTAQASHPSSRNCWEVSAGRDASDRIELTTSCSVGGS